MQKIRSLHLYLGALKIFVIIMTVSFIFSIVLGVVMAFKLNRSRQAVLYCLAAGVVIPFILVLTRLVG